MLEAVAGGEGVAPGFVELAPLVYADDPRWIPEDGAALAASFAAENPWFGSNRAITVCTPGAVRVAGFFNPELRIDGRSVAFFGCFESRGTAAQDAAAFAHIESWAKQHGAEQLYGPIDFSTFGRYRLRLSTESGDALPFPGEPYNPSDYPDRLARLGFSIAQEYLTYVGSATVAQLSLPAKRPIRDGLCAQGFTFAPLSHAEWLRRLPELHGMVDAIFAENFAYTPLSDEAFARACGPSFIAKACPHTSVIATAPDGTLAGFFLTFPHYGPLVNQDAGRDRVAVADLRFDPHGMALCATGQATALAKTVGVAPAYRSVGLMDAMTVTTFEAGSTIYDTWLGALIRCDNHSANYAAGRGLPERRYGLFVKEMSQHT